MEEAEEHLRANHLSKSMQAQKRASKKLWDMVKALEKQNRDEFSMEFRNIEARMSQMTSEIDRLIELQQGIMDETVILPTGGETDPLGDRHIAEFIDLSASQHKLHNRCERFTGNVENIFKDLILFDIDPVSPLKKALVSMEEAAQHLTELRQPSAIEAEKGAVDNLEKAREELAKALSKLLQEAQLQQMMMQMSILDEMIEKQSKINSDTKEVDKKIKPEQPVPDALERLIRKLSRRQGELGDTADELKERLRGMDEIAELMKKVAKELSDLKTGRKTQSMQEEILERLAQLLMELQMQMSGAAQAMGMSLFGGGGGGGNRSGAQLTPRLRQRPQGISDDDWARLPESLKKELLDAWSEDYPARFRRLLNLYYRRLSTEEAR
jgi:hypothetical protein